MEGQIKITLWYPYCVSLGQTITQILAAAAQVWGNLEKDGERKQLKTTVLAAQL